MSYESILCVENIVYTKFSDNIWPVPNCHECMEVVSGMGNGMGVISYVRCPWNGMGVIISHVCRPGNGMHCVE